ncbi:cell wall manno protein MnpA [Aspergillus campestris IBT 28561]|uniref:Cell wall mannoprotein 1 n=1 Tax=Aspergillus campestris (strain IBT 28561) TaxID=1392248 RepID=A0A2I1D769_ASPC2|nr:cell wall manno protein MnpA [Aspergillus campestris IBT 28561]PKY05707.1 cell wall manno protein MnpA [Aspergillus campestris IBT 28561]
MKFTALFTLGLATSAIATPSLVQRDGKEVQSLIKDISAKTEALDSAISSYNGGDASKVQSASEELISVTTKGTETVKAGDDLTSSDALGLTSPIQDLTDKIETAVDNLISKKSKFEAAGAAGEIKAALSEQFDAAKGLAEALSAKVPEALSDIADELSAGITKALQKGVDAYKDAKDGGNGGGDKPEPTEKPEPTGGNGGDDKPEPTGGNGGSTTSAPVIPGPTAAPTASSSGVPAPTGSAAPPVFTGAASRAGFSFGGAAVAAAIAIAI